MSSRFVFGALAGALALGNALQAQPTARALVERAAAAMGGAERISGVRTLVLEGTGAQFNLGQNVTPLAPLPRYEVTRWRRAIDLAAGRWRFEVDREPRFPTPNPAVQRFHASFDSVGWDRLPNGTLRRTSARGDEDRASELLYHPVRLLQVALRRGTELTRAGTTGGLHRVRMNAAGHKFAFLLDARTGLPDRVEKIIYHPMLGDVVQETRFADWAESDGLRLPTRLVQRIDGRFLVSDLRVATTRVNGTTDAGDLAVPADIRSAPPLAAPAAVVAVDTVAPGVWYLAGSSHHSVVIEMRDHLLLVEAPQSEERTLALIGAARALRPAKPLRAVINSHHHFDHAAGIRAAIASGITIITHESNVAFLQDVARRQHFIVRDTLARAPRRATIEGVGAKRVLTDGARSVELHHLAGNPHGGSMLIVYLPAERLIVQADAYNPPAPNAPSAPSYPFAPNLVATIDRLGLQVDRVVPLHGQVVPMSELRRAAGG